MLKVENLNTLLSSLEDNQYVLCSIEVTDSKGKLSVNAPIPTDISSKICNEINKFSTDRVILICRSRSEQYTNPFPYPETLKEIIKSINKKVTIFYQNPYPSNVPKFNKNLFTVRFGFDNGCLLDRICVSQPAVEMNCGDGTYYYLISNNKTIYIK